ncbi:MAG: UbiA family prenyltransferase [Candidatus Hodarchaeota archaeon]
MFLRTFIHDIYDLTRLPLGVMGAIAGLTVGMFVVLIQEKEPGDNTILLILELLPQYWELAILGLSIPFLIIGASMSINDYHDYEADRINMRMDRPLVRNPNLNPQYVLFLALTMIVAGILLSFILFIDNCLVVIGVAIYSFLAISYNLWTKERGLIGNITVAACDTGPYLLALIAMGGSDTETTFLVLIMAGITFFGVIGRELVKGIMDMEGDRITESHTFAVKYGPKQAVQLASLFFFSVIILSPLPLFIKFNNNLLYAGFMLITIILLFYSVLILYSDPSVSTGKKARSLTRTALWTGAIAFLVGVMFLP